jgi:Beta-propeller repeat
MTQKKGDIRPPFPHPAGETNRISLPMDLNISLPRAAALTLLIVSTISILVVVRRVPAPQSATQTPAQVRDAYGKLPLSFEENRGQANNSIDFVARGPGYAVALSPTETIFALRKSENGVRTDNASNVRKISNSLSKPDGLGAIQPVQSTALRMNLVGANPEAKVTGQDELQGRVNYFIGNDSAKWRSDVPTFRRVRYTQVYPGIDVVYYGNQRRLEYDFVIAPGRDARAIALEFTGADKVAVETATGDLLISVGGENIRQHKPIAYQEINGERRQIEGRYAMQSNGRVGFEVGAYDARAALVIDPVLEYSTYLGGSGEDQGTCIAVDAAGNAYVAGSTNSTNFPAANPLQGANAGQYDVFVSKLNAAGTALIYSTYLGGSFSDGCGGIAVDSAGNAYLAGGTVSTNFPTVNAIQSVSGGDGWADAFVSKLNANGSVLIYSTYLGGNRNDGASGIAVDSAGNAYVTGGTESANFPIANAFQAAFAGLADAFVAKLNPAGTALVYSTYLGGIGEDLGRGIAVDSTGNAYVTGSTYATNFPTVNAIQAVRGGDQDAFVTKINAAGSALIYSTYLGGSKMDFSNGIALDSAGNAYVTGATFSTNFPTANALQNSFGGSDSDAFVTKLNAAGTALVYSTYLGGNGYDIGNDIAVDSAGNAYVTGLTISTNFPTANAFQSALGHVDFDDVFVTKLNAAGSALVYSSYLGGTDYDYGYGIAVDSAGNAYVTGSTQSRCFPTTTGAFDTTWSLGVPDAFVTKISETAQPSTLTPCPSQLLNIATRTRVLAGDGVLIGGFTVTGGSAVKRMLIRGIGPSLNVPGALANPVLEFYDSFAGNPPFASNDDWITNRAEIEATGIPPSNDLESAIVMSLQPGAFTAVLRGKDNGVGIGVVEVYDLNPDVPAILSNISGRGFVGTGDNVMIGGFIVGGDGQANARVVVRGLGPSLGAFGVTGALPDPIIDLKNANGTTLMSNDDWQQGQPTELNSLGLAPNDTRESALVIAVPHGNYTAILRGKGGSTGLGVVEVYNVP